MAPVADLPGIGALVPRRYPSRLTFEQRGWRSRVMRWSVNA